MKEVINFNVGKHTISFEILNILMTVKYEDSATVVPSPDETLLGIINYKSVPTPIYDLSMVLDGVDAKSRMDELVQLLHDREKDHDDWLEALEASITKGIPFAKPKDPHQCKFGVWYDNFTSENQDLMLILKKFNEPHVELHSYADKLLAKAESGQVEEAQKELRHARNTTLASLKKLFNAARESITDSYKPIIVYTTMDGITPCLGFLVDSVADAMNVNESDIKSFTNNNDMQFIGNLNLPSMVKGLINKNDVNSLLIDPSQAKESLPEEVEVA
jgi:chemotaxis signal transduction protein